MKKDTNTALNMLAKLTYNSLQIIKCLQDDILSRDTYPVMEQEIDYETATESLWDAAVAIRTSPTRRKETLAFIERKTLTQNSICDTILT